MSPFRTILFTGLAVAISSAQARAAAPAAAEPAKASAVFTDGRKVPLFDPSSAAVPVARVGGEAVPLSDLTDALGTMHQEGAEGGAGKIEPRLVLDRIVDLHLVAREARAMGIGDLPEVKAAMARYADGVLADLLRQRVARTAKADPAKVEAKYRDLVREWNVSSVLFAQQADAKAFAAAAARPGARFAELAKKSAAEKKAQGSGEPSWLREKQLQKPIADAVKKLPAGKVSGPIALGKQWVVLRQDGVRYPEDAEKRASVADAVGAPARAKALRTYYAELEKRYAKIDRKLLKSLDFAAAKPGLKALIDDRRPLARIEGEKPVTVGDVAEALARKLYHETDRAESRRILNDKKIATFDDLLQRRLFTKQARVEKLDETEGFRAAMARQESSVLVGAYVQKVLAPSVTVSEEEARKYYAGHKADYASPEMVRLEAIAFTTEQAAADALRKARAGTDFRWLSQNLPDQVAPDKRSLEFPPDPVAVSVLAEGVAKAIAGAKPGDYRSYQDSPTQNYLLHLVERRAPDVYPYENVSGTVKSKLSDQKLDQAFKEAVGKLRQSEHVEILLARIEL